MRPLSHSISSLRLIYKTGDLWAALSDASGRNVERDMATWTKKIGYPVITVEEHGSKILLTQNRYLRTADVKPEEDETLWPIFLGLRTDSGVSENLTFQTRNTSINLDNSDFYKLNANHTGVYRTLYPPDRLTKLVQAAHLLSTEDRAGLLGDAGDLATSGYQKTSSLLDLLVVVAICIRAFTSEEAIADIEKFFKDKSLKGFDKILARSLDGIRAKAAWVKRDVDDVKAWLETNGYMPTKRV